MSHQELCAELYALKPEWNDTRLWFTKSLAPSDSKVMFEPHDPTNHPYCDVPAYDLEWCLAKLPATTKIVKADDKTYSAIHIPKPKSPDNILKYADTPTNAALKLLIELVKAGLLKQQEGE